MDTGTLTLRQEQRYKERILELQRKLRFYETTVSNVIHDLKGPQEPDIAYTVLVLREMLDDPRYKEGR